jgi:hypothetical protein
LETPREFGRRRESKGPFSRLPVTIGDVASCRLDGCQFPAVFGAAASANRVEALRAGLRDLGWVEGKNILIEFRWAERVDQLPDLAAELVRIKVDLIFAPSSTFVEPARKATQTIPIVFALDADPVGLGHVASLARPGGNITGLTMQSTELNTKQLEILKEALPQSTRFGVLWNPSTPSHQLGLPGNPGRRRNAGDHAHRGTGAHR